MAHPSNVNFAHGNPVALRGGGTERDLHPASGLRIANQCVLTQSAATTAAYVFSSTSLDNGGAPRGVVAEFQNGFREVQLANGTDVGGLENGTLVNQVLPYPTTLALTYTTSVASVEVRFRVSGFDQFGNPIRETLPWMTTNAQAVVNSSLFTPQTIQWTSKVFSRIEKIEMQLGANASDSDIVAVGLRHFWDRNTQQAYLYNGATGGSYTLTVNFPGGGSETTGAIAWNADAAAITTALEALTGITDVTVTEDSIFRLITFVNPSNLDWTNLSVDDALLTGGTETAVLSGLAFRGHGNQGLGSPIKLYAYGTPVTDNVYPDLEGLTTINHTRSLQVTHHAPANDLTNPTNAGYRLGHSETGYEGFAHKVGLHYWSNRPSDDGGPVQRADVFANQEQARFFEGNAVSWHLHWRSTIGTGRQPTIVSTYPNG